MVMWLAQLVEDETTHIKIIGLSPAVDTGRHSPPVHQVAKWVPVILTRMKSHLFIPFVPIKIVMCVMLPRELSVDGAGVFRKGVK